MKLNKLIKLYGEPDVLIDHWDTTSIPYAIWGFEEIYYINYKGEAFINDTLINGNPLKYFQKILDRWKTENDILAAVGYISFDLKNVLFPHIKFKKTNNKDPLMWFGKPKKILPYDLKKSNVENLPNLFSMTQDIPSIKEYEKSINIIKSYLEKGETYQINFTQPKKFSFSKKPFSIYQTMRSIIQPHCGMYINSGKIQVLSFSPERFFRKIDNIIESFPMKGTRPRSKNYVQDELLANELYKSKKDRAEHLMIVDLLRNDLGKICEYGSIKVENLYKIESYKTVHQMISRVYGTMNPSYHEMNIIEALFPGGSITGAPKERSMEIIDSLENYSRGIYTGALGTFFCNGNIDFNIAIRTMTIKNDIATYPVGGGIVWDSNPIEEWQEAQQKSKIIDIYQKDKKNSKYKREHYSNN
tara:strand:+ start:258 stop:1502 length:1245 start_codon:yes stop_codon:yes gene_type:complete